jgi:N-acetylglucosaminyldiphosphoundecaprenol N-acetyl-beta-D-mannosaminyltransferase
LTDPVKWPTSKVGDVPFAVVNMDAAVKWMVGEAADHSDPTSVRLANAYCVVLARKDVEYRALLDSDGINFPDGSPVVWSMRADGVTDAGRVRGPSFFEEVLAEGRSRNLRHFFLGATSQTLDKLRERMEIKFPELIVAGTYSPPFEPLSAEFLDGCERAVRGAEPDIIWVGLGTPKQDYVTTELSRRLRLPAAGVGAAFDFSAGTIREAPRFVQRAGFEWLFRLLMEPRRLWKRYVIGNFEFLRIVSLSRFKGWSCGDS